MSQLQVRRILHRETVLFSESQDLFALNVGKRRLRLNGQAPNLVPKENGLAWLYASPAGSDEQTV